MSEPYGPLPYAPTPEQPAFSGWCVAWEAFDVPRIWDIVAAEDNPRGWEQIKGFSQLAELLVDHHRRLKRQHFALVQAWQSPAASEMLERVQTLAEALLSDANCAQSTAHALHHIMTTYAEARVEIDRVHTRWNNVTTDWIPEWWDDAAGELNAQARSVMTKTDEAVRDYRTRILAPRSFEPFIDSAVTIDEVIQSNASEPANRFEPIPPVPGHIPYNGDPQLASSERSVPYIPAIPGQPVSMLPVPPGNVHVPFGGAYILPGPGVGQTGFVIEMPNGLRRDGSRSHNGGFGIPEGNGRAETGLRNGRQAPLHQGGGLGGAMVPMAVGTPVSGVSSNSGGIIYRRPNVVWLSRCGVPPVIEGIDDAIHLGGHSEDDEERFEEWFRELAYPWRSANKRQEPLVIIRRTAE